MNAKDIMTSKVITVTSGTRVVDVARLLLERGISAVPVMSGDRLAGIISEADLLHRYEIGTDSFPSKRHWWSTLFGSDHSSEEYVRSHARYARDIMTRDVATVTPDTALAKIATLLEERRIRRVPVLAQGKLAGIVSRSDLVRALVAAKQAGRETGPLADETIRSVLLAELRGKRWWQPELCDVRVEDGVVTYAGLVRQENERDAARVAAETVAGVRSVVDRRIEYPIMPYVI
jgi:CBS domain-containing protein